MSLVSLQDFEDAAFKKIPRNALDYYKSGAGDELSLRLNRSTFDWYLFILIDFNIDIKSVPS